MDTDGNRDSHTGDYLRPFLQHRGMAVTDVNGKVGVACASQLAQPFAKRRPGVMARAQAASRCAAQSETLSPLLISGRTRPSIRKVGETWMPFCRASLQCHLISRSRLGIAKAAASFNPLYPSIRATMSLGVAFMFGPPA